MFFQIWFVRIALLVKLRMFSSAEAELNAFKDFDAPDLYYQYYPDEQYQGKKGQYYIQDSYIYPYTNSVNKKRHELFP